MTVQVSEKGIPLSELAKSGATFALEILKQQADWLSVIRERVVHLSANRPYPEVVNRMIAATQYLNDPD